jgi:hypothetical protein
MRSFRKGGWPLQPRGPICLKKEPPVWVPFCYVSVNANGFLAVFGPEAEESLMKLHRARREIEVAAETLQDARHGNMDGELNARLRMAIWGAGRTNKDDDRVGRDLDEFQDGIEKICRPVVNQVSGRGRTVRSR